MSSHSTRTRVLVMLVIAFGGLMYLSLALDLMQRGFDRTPPPPAPSPHPAAPAKPEPVDVHTTPPKRRRAATPTTRKEKP